MKTLLPVVCLFSAVAFAQTSIFPLLPPSVSTIPANGDVNPYGVAFVPKTVPAAGGTLLAGDILVSNFNDSNNLQGTGRTIVRIDKTGQVSLFYTSPLFGLSAALGVLSNGMVVIGNLPTADGTSATASRGALTLLNRNGSLIGTLGSPATVDGPWGLTIYDTGNGVSGTAHIFFSNVLSGAIARADVTYGNGVNATVTVIASGLSHRGDPAALELGPTGLAYDAIHDVLYFASSTDNAVYSISGALAAQGVQNAALFFSDLTHLHGPLDLAFLPNGHLLVANSDGSNVDPNQPSELVEYSAAGVFLGQMPVDPNNGGAFGLGVNNLGWGIFRLAAVDDNANSLKIWTSVLQ